MKSISERLRANQNDRDGARTTTEIREPRTIREKEQLKQI